MSDDKQNLDPNIAQMFEGLFGEFFGKSGRLFTGDLRVELALDDEEAKSGVTREVEIERAVTCVPCEGRGGATPADVRVACRDCNGKGQIQHAQGFLVVSRSCATCSGEGGRIENPCTTCKGIGRTPERGKLEVVVPPGVQHEQMLRIADGERSIFVQLVVGGRPTSMELAMRQMSLEAPIPEARALPSAAEARRARMMTVLAILVVLAIAVAMLRH